MADIYNISTFNINSLSSRTRMQMLEEFLQNQDILFLQKVTHHKFDSIRGYTGYINLEKHGGVQQ